MRVYRSLTRFFCAPLDRYIPVGATIARYENAIRLVINFDPTDVTLDQLLQIGQEYETPKTVQWFYSLEPPPYGTNTSYFAFVEAKAEDAYGNVGSSGGAGLQGPQGLVGIGTQGVQGNQGLPGVQGDVGLTGPQGNQGLQGPQGWQGPQGFQGNQGLQGVQGNQGLQGVQGLQGLQGQQGWQGVIGPLWVSAPSTAISSGNPGEVAYDGANFYVCVSSNTWRRTPIAGW